MAAIRIAGVLCTLVVALAAATGVDGRQDPKVPPVAVGSKPAAAAARPTPPPSLTGTVKGPDGKPVAEALVVARPADAVASVAPRDAPVTTRTDAAGAFRLVLGRRSPHTVSVTTRGLAGQTIERAAPGAALSVVLQKGRAIQGRVRDARTGQPIAGARVRAIDERAVQAPWELDAAVVRAATDSRGRYVLDGLGAGPFTLNASAPAYGRATRALVAPGTTADFVLTAGVSLSGTVADRGGRPVAAAVVFALPEMSRSAGGLPEATDDHGRFEVLGLEPGAYRLVVRHRDFAPGTSVVRVERGLDVQVSVTLDSGTSVVGRLVGADGAPAQGQVGVEESDDKPLAGAFRDLLRAESGADGRFRIERVPPGAHVLLAAGRGHAPKRIDAVVGGSATLDLGDIELESGLVIRGRVTDKAGQPVADAHLEATPVRYGMRRQATSRSEPDGSFVLAGLEPGVVEVHVDAPGHAAAERRVEAGSTGVAFVLEAAGGIAGAVTDERGRPVEVFSVVALAEDQGLRRQAPGFKTVSSPDGRFLLDDLAAGTYVLQVMATDRMAASVSALRVTAGATTDAGRIRLETGATVRGVVVDAEGAGIGGAGITVRGTEDDLGFLFAEGPQAISDAGGSFEVSGVAPGTVRVNATHPEYAPARPVLVEVDPAVGASDVRVVLGQGGRVEGRARRRDGLGVAGAHVRVVPFARRGILSFDQWAAQTASDGSFAIDHVPVGRATVVLMAGAEGTAIGGAQAKEVEIREGETATVELVPSEILVSGRVTRRGEAVGGVALHFRGGGSRGMFIRPPSDLPPGQGPQRMRAVTRDDGGYELLLDGPGSYAVLAQSGDGRAGWPNRTVEVPEADSFTLDLDYGGVPVAGVVVDRETERPVPGAGVWASRRPGPRAASAIAGADGRFQLDLDPGDYQVAASADGYGQARAEVAVGDSGVPDLRLALDRGHTLAGRVVDARGRGVGGISVDAVGGDGREASYGSSETLPDGTFRMGGLEPIPHTVSVGSDLAGFALQGGVEPGQGPVTLTLKPGGRVRVVVRDAGGAPVADAWCYVRVVGGLRTAGAIAGTHTDATGVADFLAPVGEVQVSATTRQATGHVTLTVAAGEVSSGEITLVEKPAAESE